MIHVLLLACYELGHQPLSLAWPTAVLQSEGFQVTAVDLAVSAFPHQAAQEAHFVGIAVPMHTALRLGVHAARQVREHNPTAHICFYGLYAWLNADYLLDNVAHSVIAGEYEQPLCQLVHQVAAGGDGTGIAGVSTATHHTTPHLQRLTFPVPERTQLPPLTGYAHYQHNGSSKTAGYTETSRGCLHTCHHCPVVPVYNGRFFIIPADVVLADIRQQVAAGAGHITFGDPDFLNGPGHALKIVHALHAEFPHLTFDFTTKVEHILQHRHLLADFREAGCRFIVSAFESTSDVVLAHLHKGHTLAHMDTALAILAEARLPVQPTWVPFTPWTTLDDYLTMLEWIRTRRLIQHVPAVQLAVRLLVPPHSALLTADHHQWSGSLDAANFAYQWQHPDPRMDALYTAVVAIAEHHAHDDAYDVFAQIEHIAYQTAERPCPQWDRPTTPDLPPPRLTEDWFC